MAFNSGKALSTAAKGASIGATVGSFVPIPGFGTLAGAGIGALAGGVIGGFHDGKNKAIREAEDAEKAAIEGMKDTKYADYNQSYFNELQRRSSVGLQQEQMTAMQQGADRAAGVGLQTTGNRRGGLMGIGQAQTSLADAYRNIGLADVAQREQNTQSMLGEWGNRGQMSYGEGMRDSGMDLALAGRNREEEIQKQQAQQQEMMDSVASLGLTMGGASGDEIDISSLFGNNGGSKWGLNPNFNPSLNQ